MGSAERAPWSVDRAREALTIVLLAVLPLSTAAQEVTLGLLLALAVVGGLRGAGAAPWMPAALGLSLVWLLAVPVSGQVREGLGHVWVLAPLVAVAGQPAERATRAGLVAAAVAAVWAVAQAALGEPGRAGFSHHLTLAYALLPALGVAVTRRAWPVVLLVTAGVVATGSQGALPALATTLAAAAWGLQRSARGRTPGGDRRWLPAPAVVAAVGGALVTVALLPLLATPDDLRQRAILWTGGLLLLPSGPVGPGGYPQASAGVYEALSPGFWFPNHAHDAAVQVLAVLGPVGLVALLALVGACLGRAHPGAAAGLAGITVGALTQDTFGDLEVARAAWVWVALLGWNPAPASGSDTPDR